MPAVLTTASQGQCPHGGMAALVTTQDQLSAGGSPVLLETDVHMIAGCAFVVATVPCPCVRIQWSGASTTLQVNGAAVLHAGSIGQTVNAVGAPQGVAIISRAAAMLEAL